MIRRECSSSSEKKLIVDDSMHEPEDAHDS